MKPTENYEQLLVRFTKRIEQLKGKDVATPREMEMIYELLHYLRGCKETIEYLMTGKLPDDGNHVGMNHHKPVTMLKRPVRHNDLGSMD